MILRFLLLLAQEPPEALQTLQGPSTNPQLACSMKAACETGSPCRCELQNC